MYSYDADSAAFIKRAQGLTASDCARAGAAVGAAFGRGRVGVACRNDEYSRACADAVCAGLRVSGVNAWSFGASFESQLSFLVRMRQGGDGQHLRRKRAERVRGARQKGGGFHGDRFISRAVVRATL